jgi:hypothetical protein
VYGIGDAQHDERAFSREGKAGLGGIQTCTRSFLNLPNTDALFPYNRADEDVRNEETEGVGLGLGGGGFLEWFLVQSANDEAEGFGNGINVSTDGEDTLNSTAGVLADGALCAGKLTDLADILAALTDDGRCLCTGDDGAHVQPLGLVLLVVWLTGGWRRAEVQLSIRTVLRKHRDRRSSRAIRGSSIRRCVWHHRVALLVGDLGLWLDLSSDGKLGLGLHSRIAHICIGGLFRLEADGVLCGLFTIRPVVLEDLVKRGSLGLGLVGRRGW